MRPPILFYNLPSIELGDMTTSENIQRDGNMLVVPFENPVFPKRCLKTNLEVKECDFSIVIESSSLKLSQSDAALAATAVAGKAGRAGLAVAEMLATRKKLPLKIGLCDSKKSLFKKLKYGSFGCILGGPAVAFAILIPLIQIAEAAGKQPDLNIVLAAAITGGVLFVTGIVLFAIANLGVLRATQRSETHVWLEGACKDFLNSLPTYTPKKG